MLRTLSSHRVLSQARLRQGAAVIAALVTAAVLAMAVGPAGAQPQPTITSVQKRLAKLTSQEDRVVQHFDQVAQQLSSATQRLTLVNREVTRDRKQFQDMRGQIAQVAAFAYENGSMSSPMSLLTSSNPKMVLSQAAFLSQLATSRHQQLQQFITAARQLEGAQQTAKRTEKAVSGLKSQLGAQKAQIAKVISKQKTILATLTAQQRQTATAGVGGITSAIYTGPTATQAQKAVAFAYAQLGKPYVFGGTGPSGYDCSGLVQAAWASAGVSIPRDTYSQWSALPHVPMSSIQPGDLIFFDGEGHVAIYVGGNMIIDAPQQGESVEKISLSNSWYASTLDGAARP